MESIEEKRNFFKEPSKKSSRFISFITKRIFDFSHKIMISRARKDFKFRRSIENFKATIQVSTNDDKLHRALIFDGKGDILYVKGKVENPDAMVLYRSIRDLFIFLRNFGDVVEAMEKHRFEVKGNIYVFFKFGYLANYYNPKQKKIKFKRQKIIKSLK